MIKPFNNGLCDYDQTELQGPACECGQSGLIITQHWLQFRHLSIKLSLAIVYLGDSRPTQDSSLIGLSMMLCLHWTLLKTALPVGHAVGLKRTFYRPKNNKTHHFFCKEVCHVVQYTKLFKIATLAWRNCPWTDCTPAHSAMCFADVLFNADAACSLNNLVGASATWGIIFASTPLAFTICF